MGEPDLPLQFRAPAVPGRPPPPFAASGRALVLRSCWSATPGYCWAGTLGSLPLIRGAALGPAAPPLTNLRGGGAASPLQPETTMTRTTVANRGNLSLIEEYYEKWLKDPDSVEASWRNFFEGYELGQSYKDVTAIDDAGPAPLQEAVKAVTRLVDAYREMGHHLADLDPLKLTPRPKSYEQLELAAFGLSESDLDQVFYSKLGTNNHCRLRELLGILHQTYCRTIGVEFMHIRDLEVRHWLLDRMESVQNRPGFDIKKKRRIIYKLNAAELFENFLHKNYVGQKRFSLEGGEMLIPLLDAVIERAGAHGVLEIVLGMPHRGRLNVLANILHKPYSLIFSEFEGNMPETVAGDGDVKYHLGFSADHVTQEKRTIHLTLTPNPSHLEAVNPVVEGRTRAKQRRYQDKDRKQGVPVLIHGDAAFAGQGLVAETLNLSQLPGYRTGGTIHIVVNNQIGFTTSPSEARSTRYCTDVAKMIEVPIFHVNGEDPEAVVYVGELATDFRQTFGQDVVIDMICYRRHGHNEGDEPGFTQPLMYEKIKNRISIRELYTEQLVMSGELSSQEAETIAETFAEKMQEIFEEVKVRGVEPRTVAPGYATGPWASLTPRYSFETVETGVAYETLKAIAAASATPPPGFNVNPKLSRIFSARVKTLDARGALDWSFAENMAFGSLLLEGTPVRLSGQDSRRGTFSQRHVALIDQHNGERWMPLSQSGTRPARILRLRQPALRGSRARIRLRLLARRAQHAADVGGPVRRLRQRSTGDHRPVHRLRREQVGPRQWTGHAAASRLRGPGARALQRPPGTLPRAVRRGEYPGRRSLDAGAVLPPASPPGQAELPQAPDRDDPQEPAPPQGRCFSRRTSAGRELRQRPR